MLEAYNSCTALSSGIYMLDAAKLVVKGYGTAGYQKVIADSPPAV
jgi:hypothetical protein